VGTVQLVRFTTTVDKSGTRQGIDGKGKGRVHHITGHDGLGGVSRDIALLLL
jgi:hypothetical protein